MRRYLPLHHQIATYCFIATLQIALLNTLFSADFAAVAWLTFQPVGRATFTEEGRSGGLCMLTPQDQSRWARSGMTSIVRW